MPHRRTGTPGVVGSFGPLLHRPETLAACERQGKTPLPRGGRPPQPTGSVCEGKSKALSRVTAMRD